MGNWFCCCIDEDLFVPIETLYRYNDNEPGLSYYTFNHSRWETKVSKKN